MIAEQSDLVCDFCNRSGVVSMHPVKGPIFVRTNENGVDLLDETPWAACGVCDSLINAGNIKGFRARVEASTPYPVGATEEVAQKLAAESRRRIGSFWLNRLPSEPLV